MKSQSLNACGNDFRDHGYHAQENHQDPTKNQCNNRTCYETFNVVALGQQRPRQLEKAFDENISGRTADSTHERHCFFLGLSLRPGTNRDADKLGFFSDWRIYLLDGSAEQGIVLIFTKMLNKSRHRPLSQEINPRFQA
jgi:hypothetical protein